MHFHAKYVSGSVSGDYYQLLLELEKSEEDEPGQTGPYLLLQRQFEFFDGGKCNVESDDENYIGHFELKLMELSPICLAFEIVRGNHNHVAVGFALTEVEFDEVRPIAEVIFGLREPETDFDGEF